MGLQLPDIAGKPGITTARWRRDSRQGKVPVRPREFLGPRRAHVVGCHGRRSTLQVSCTSPTRRRGAVFRISPAGEAPNWVTSSGSGDGRARRRGTSSRARRRSPPASGGLSTIWRSGRARATADRRRSRRCHWHPHPPPPPRYHRGHACQRPHRPRYRRRRHPSSDRCGLAARGIHTSRIRSCGSMSPTPIARARGRRW
jgi:hypothetical protein